VRADDPLLGLVQPQPREDRATFAGDALDRGALFVEVERGLGVARQDALRDPIAQRLRGDLEAMRLVARRALDVRGVVGRARQQRLFVVRAYDVVGRGDDVVRVDALGVVPQAAKRADLGDGALLRSGCALTPTKRAS
jgi:hypothetical protein